MFATNLHVCLVFTIHALSRCEAYKVLAVFPVPAMSHSILGDGVVRHLLEAGHDVTYITSFPKQNPSVREIDISSIRIFFPDSLGSIELIMKNRSRVDMFEITSIFMSVSRKFLEHEAVKELFSDPNEHFDLVIVEWMFHSLYSGISAVFNCPYIWFASVEPHWMLFKLIDEIPNPAYNPDAYSNNVAPFSFTQRVQELVNFGFGIGFQYFYTDRLEQEEYERLLVPIIKKRCHKVPDLGELRYNASLMLGNSHVSLGHPTSLPQSYKAIGGYHINENVKPLPDDLKKLLDNSKDGLIYFSMGSALQSKYMPATLKAELLAMFGKLKYNILWKFEDDLPNRPSNVHIQNWAPQTSILEVMVEYEYKGIGRVKLENTTYLEIPEHPNCILFITHGGLLSTTEAIHFGKPFIGIPVYGDQFNNIDRFVKKGVAKRVDLSYTMSDNLGTAIEEMMKDSSYLTKIKELSFIYHDRPVSPGKELVHWVEHVVRTAGAAHLRSPALLVPWYQKCYLDLVALIIIILYAARQRAQVLYKKRFSKQLQKLKRQ